MSTTDSSTLDTPTTEFLKIEREQFDKVLRVGTPEFLAKVPSLTVDELQRGERWIDGVRSQKKSNTYLTFPVRQEKQQAAGVLYFKAMNAFRKAVRTELASRLVADMFAPDTTADVTDAVAA